MSFTYDFTTAPLIAYVRLLIPDTNQATAIFSDEEITAAYTIVGMQYQSSQFYSGLAGNNLPVYPVSVLRVAAILCDSAAGSQQRLDSIITQLLDVKADPSLRLKAAQAFRDQATNYRAIDDDAGAFSVIEQCSTSWALNQRWWNQIQRQSLGI